MTFIAIGGVVAVLVSLPKHGSWRYGACKVFLESHVRFPTPLRVIDASESQTSVNITFSDMNPFGAEMVREFRCYYSVTPQGRTMLSKVTVYDGMKDGPVPLPDHETAKYNAMLPALAATEPDTTLPDDPPVSIHDYK